MEGENRSDQCSPANERTANKSVFYHQKRAQRAAALGCCLSLYCGSNGLLMEDVYTHGGFTTSLQLLCMFTSLYVCILIFLTQIFILGFLPVINQNRTEPKKNDKNWGWEVTRHDSDSDINSWLRKQYYSEIDSVFYNFTCCFVIYIYIQWGLKKTETTIIIMFDTD